MMDEQDLKMELIYSLPSKRMLEVTNNLAVKHPITKELIFLKQRPNFESAPLSEYIQYNERHNPFHDYRELLFTSVIVDLSLLNRRGKKALGLT